ncbi:hypothetical protein I7I48_03610 [Histoplasma ohiense]|nr:hypothetical protein I7I48_03610 [Histoplasma ohiense (nom. inval.)]
MPLTIFSFISNYELSYEKYGCFVLSSPVELSWLKLLCNHKCRLLKCNGVVYWEAKSATTPLKDATKKR